MASHSLTPFAQDVWIADGHQVSTAGFHYGTRMAVIRLSDGSLFVWSPVTLTAELRDEVDRLGHVKHLVAPNTLHHLFLGDWMVAYPAAKAHAAPGLRAKRKDLAFEAELGDAPVAAWNGEIEHVVVPGNLITTEVVFFHRKSATVIFTDLIQNFPPGWFKGWRAIVARMDLMTGPEPTAPRKFRTAFLRRAGARAAVARILAWPIERVLAAHALPVTRDGRALVQRAFSWLTG